MKILGSFNRLVSEMIYLRLATPISPTIGVSKAALLQVINYAFWTRRLEEVFREVT